VNYLQEFDSHLTAVSVTPAVLDFSEQAAQSRLCESPSDQTGVMP